MWNQWSSGPPMPPPSTVNQLPPIIGPVQPTASVPAASEAAPPSQPIGNIPSQPAAYSTNSAPTYTPAQYAAMTPEQQYAVQQHWQQWQAYEQQYAQWHAQYGEQYKREMAAIQGAPPTNIQQYNTGATQSVNSFAYPPPAVTNQYQAPPVPVAHAPPPPPPDDNVNPMGIKAPPQIYEQPPPPPPPPQPKQEDKLQSTGGLSSQFQGSAPIPSSQFSSGQENRWSQPPPLMQNQGGNRWGDSGPQIAQQDRNQQNQFNQFNNNNNNMNNNQRGRQNQQRDQRDNQGRDNWQGGGNRQNNDFRGRGGRGRGDNNFDNNRQQQFDDSDNRNNRNQQWQNSGDGPGQRNNNRGNFSNRFDSNNANSADGMNHQGPSGWNNSNQGNNFSSPEGQRQQQQNVQNQNTSGGNSQNNQKSGSGVDEKAFDEQFRMWEEQFENWKKENANHPDRTMYKQYEQEFEKTRIRLLERREQMRRRKMLELQQSMTPQQFQQLQQQQQQQQQQPPPPELPVDECLPEEDDVPKQLEESKASSDIKQGEPSDMEQSDPEDEGNANVQDNKLAVESQVICPPTTVQSADIFQKNEIGDLFKSSGGGGIPGLDLVGSKDDEKDGPSVDRAPVADIIDLDNDGPSRPAKVAATAGNIAALQPLPMQQAAFKPELASRAPQIPFLAAQPVQRKIPSLFDIVVEKPLLSPDSADRNKSPVRDPSPTVSRSSKADIPFDNVDARSRSISKDRDLLESPLQRPLSQLSSSQHSQQQQQKVPDEQQPRQPFFNQQQSAPNLPPHTADIAKALQDPNVMQLLTVALAQAQQAGGLNQSNPQQSQLIQQLQQLQPLLQMQQQQDRNSNQPWNNSQAQPERNSNNNQPWNNSQAQPERNSNNNQSWNNNPLSQQRPSQPWQNQNQNSNQNFNNRSGGNNSNQNRNSWGGNPFNRNNNNNNSNDQLPQQNRGPSESGNESDSNNDMQQRNPRNPFRRSMGGGGGSASGSLSGGFGSGDDNTGPANNNFDRPFDISSGPNPFNNNNNGNNNNSGPSGPPSLFGNQMNAQQNRGGNFGGAGRFDNNRPQTNFGNSLGFRNNQNNFGDRGDRGGGGGGGDDNDYYRPAQVFDYQNRSRADAMVPPTKVVDYGHRPSPMVMPSNSFNRDNSEFVPVKTIDYGHASNSVQNENHFQQKNSNFSNNMNRWNQNQQFQNRGPNQFQQPQSRGQSQSQSSSQYKGQNFNKANLSQSLLPASSDTVQEQQQQMQKATEQTNAPSDGDTEEPNQLDTNDDENDLNDYNLNGGYPNNKWILQNSESRQRPGPPTKRGKRNPTVLEAKQSTMPQYSNTDECDEIEENFEEISENEEEDLKDTASNPPPPSPHFKTKSLPLFPSVSATITNTPMVFPSMENNNTIPIDEIIFKPGRLTRPKNIVIIIRGPPGSGKSHIAKLIKDKEVEMGGTTPRLLSIDDYFMIENDYEEKCPKTGRKIPKKEILYEYEKEMEDTYMQYLIKSFKKTVTDHLYDFIIVDCCNHSLRTFNEFYNAARDGNFSPFVIDMICDLDVCLEHNVHNRSIDDIKNIIKGYQDCPGHYIKLDVSNLLENVVEMEDVSDLEDNFVADCEVVDLVDDDEDDETNENEIDNDNENDNENDDNSGECLKSKWDTEPTTKNLARLDGTSKPISKRGTATLEEYLQIDGWEPPTNVDGKKRVRWADIEEKRAQDKMRAIGFVVGQTDWNRMMDPTSGSGALTKTKYIERLNKRR